MSKLKKINVSEVTGNENSIFPPGTLWIDQLNRLRISDGITQGGIGLVNSGAGGTTTLYPSAGSGGDGIIFPNDPEGGSGDAASIKWYGIAGEQMRLHVAVRNDSDDEICLDASGPVKIQAAGNNSGNEKLWSFTTTGELQVPGAIENSTQPDNFLDLNPSETVLASAANVLIKSNYNTLDQIWNFDSAGSLTFPDGAVISQSGFYAGPGQNAVFGQDDGNTQVYTQNTGVGVQTHNNGTFYTWTFGDTGNLTLPMGGSLSLSGIMEFSGGNFRKVAVPTHSTGAAGDTVGDVAFDLDHLYYCTENFSSTIYSIITSTSSMIARNYFIAYSSDPGFTSNDLTGYTVTGPGGYSGTVTGPSQDQGGNLWYIPVSPDMTQQMGTYVFTSTSGGDIWKRIAWSGDTW